MVSVFSLQAQPLTKATKKSLVEAGDESLVLKDWYNALEKYKEAYEEEKTNELAYKIALCTYELRDYVKSERYFSRLLKKDRKEKLYTAQARFPYARSLKMNEKYDESIEQFQLFISETANDTLKTLAQSEMLGAEMAKEMVETLGLTVAHGGKNINSKTSEYAPTLDVDGKTMYYAALNAKDVIILNGDEEPDYHLKIYKSEKKGGSKASKGSKSGKGKGKTRSSRGRRGSKGGDGWSKGVALDFNVNREDFHTGNPSLSKDGRIMYFTRALLERNNVVESKIYFSSKDDDEGWTGARELVGLNGEYLIQHPVVGELFGREVLYFTSDMDGGFGGNDIYYATRKGDGVYASPVNLGPKINTAGDDETPFYHDGTLYFSSTGHPGIGGFDIFYSVWDGTTWTDPTNMGQGFNSPVDDLFFRLDQEGYKGFLVSNRIGDGARSVYGKTCCNDIYTVAITKVDVSLIATITEGSKPLDGVKVSLIEMTKNGKGDSKSKETGKSNKAAFELATDKAYTIIATKEGYYPDTLEFNTVGLVENKEFNKTLKLKAMPKPEPVMETYTINEPIELKNIFYEFDDDEILAESEPDLGIILDLMNRYPDMTIDLYSHTDSRGKDSYNKSLSQRRANSAKEWLTDRDVEASRITAIGKGEKEIRNQCSNGAKCSEAEHRYNRRTEFKITAGPTTIQIEKTRLRKKE